LRFKLVVHFQCEPVGVGFIRPENNGRHKCRPYNRKLIDIQMVKREDLEKVAG